MYKKKVVWLFVCCCIMISLMVDVSVVMAEDADKDTAQEEIEANVFEAMLLERSDINERPELMKRFIREEIREKEGINVERLESEQAKALENQEVKQLPIKAMTDTTSSSERNQ